MERIARKLTPNKIKAGQLRDIFEVRDLMADHLCKYAPESLLSIGEGTDWKATWVGHLIHSKRLPASLNRTVIIDLVSRHGSLYERQGLAAENKMHMVYGDATRLPFSKDSFSLVVASLMVDDCKDHQQLFAELYRCSGNYIMVAGHGLDITDELKKMEGILGNRHLNPCVPDKAAALMTQQGAASVLRWHNQHTWLEVFIK